MPPATPYSAPSVAPLATFSPPALVDARSPSSIRSYLYAKYISAGKEEGKYQATIGARPRAARSMSKPTDAAAAETVSFRSAPDATPISMAAYTCAY